MGAKLLSMRTKALLLLAITFSSGCELRYSPGRLAPDFMLKDLEGKDASLASFRGKAILLTFWAVG